MIHSSSIVCMLFVCYMLVPALSNMQMALPQVSGDDQRRLCSEHTKLSGTVGGSIAGETGLPLGVSLATYGSVAYQLKDANLEASGTCDFVCRALRIVNKTGRSVFFGF